MAKKKAKGKGRGWHGDSVGHSVAARKSGRGKYGTNKSWDKGAKTKKKARRENEKIANILTKRIETGSKGGKLSIGNPKRNPHHPTNRRLRQRRDRNMLVILGKKR